jgi:hypothetical protein
MDRDTARFIQELSKEVEQALEMVKVRMSVADPAKTFTTSNTIAALHLITLDYALRHGVDAEKFLAAMRSLADSLDVQLQTKTGVFAPAPK